eukprot:GHVT01080158.1.p1 GENE.GHVT01080158.1~~GHVT01080158.1.p1  ORF type:complete len:596 (-),score=57.98 GHVT01080158.1:1800-3587(-)
MLSSRRAPCSTQGDGATKKPAEGEDDITFFFRAAVTQSDTVLVHPVPLIRLSDQDVQDKELEAAYLTFKDIITIECLDAKLKALEHLHDCEGLLLSAVCATSISGARFRETPQLEREDAVEKLRKKLLSAVVVLADVPVVPSKVSASDAGVASRTMLARDKFPTPEAIMLQLRKLFTVLVTFWDTENSCSVWSSGSQRPTAGGRLSSQPSNNEHSGGVAGTASGSGELLVNSVAPRSRPVVLRSRSQPYRRPGQPETAPVIEENSNKTNSEFYMTCSNEFRDDMLQRIGVFHIKVKDAKATLQAAIEDFYECVRTAPNGRRQEHFEMKVEAAERVITAGVTPKSIADLCIEFRKIQYEGCLAAAVKPFARILAVQKDLFTLIVTSWPLYILVRAATSEMHHQALRCRWTNDQYWRLLRFGLGQDGKCRNVIPNARRQPPQIQNTKQDEVSISSGDFRPVMLPYRKRSGSQGIFNPLDDSWTEEPPSRHRRLQSQTRTPTSKTLCRPDMLRLVPSSRQYRSPETYSRGSFDESFDPAEYPNPSPQLYRDDDYDPDCEERQQYHRNQLLLSREEYRQPPQRPQPRYDPRDNYLGHAF